MYAEIFVEACCWFCNSKLVYPCLICCILQLRNFASGKAVNKLCALEWPRKRFPIILPDGRAGLYLLFSVFIFQYLNEVVNL